MGKDDSMRDVPMFDGERTDFRDWKSRMINALVEKDYDMVVGIDLETMNLGEEPDLHPAVKDEDTLAVAERTPSSARISRPGQ
jgi:hypothetical protein